MPLAAVTKDQTITFKVGFLIILLLQFNIDDNGIPRRGEEQNEVRLDRVNRQANTRNTGGRANRVSK